MKIIKPTDEELRKQINISLFCLYSSGFMFILCLILALFSNRTIFYITMFVSLIFFVAFGLDQKLDKIRLEIRGQKLW